MKTQTVRLIDMFILGPFMIYAGMQMRKDWMQVAMIIGGAATIVYNAQNFYQYERGPYIPHLHTTECPTGYTTQPECL
jgi:hypothetical protein